jgi:hypothetical protein
MQNLSYLVTCSCGKKSVITYSAQHDDWIAVEDGWEFSFSTPTTKSRGWNCGSLDHYSIEIDHAQHKLPTGFIQPNDNAIPSPTTFF